MKSNIEMKIEFIAGTSIEDAVKEAKYKASRWNVAYICFDFNGTKMSIGCDANIEWVVHRYNSQSEKYIVAG